MSAGLVIFIFRSEPSTTCTSCPMRSTSPASSEAFTPSASARAKASFRSFVENACGVCASTTRSRGTVPVINATSSGKLARFTSLTVSIAGIPRIAASHRRASSITRAICSGVTKGLTASCTSTISVPFATSRSAAPTESCRESPPFTTRTVCLNFSRAIISLRRATSSARVATMMSVTCGQAAIRRRLRITIGVPSSSRNCLGFSAPMRVPIPAAGRMAAIRLMFGAVPPGRFKAGLANFRVYLKRGRGVNSVAVAGAPGRRPPLQQVTFASWNEQSAPAHQQLTRIGLRKNGTCLAVRRALFWKTRGCFHPTPWLGTHTAIAVATPCRGSLPQRRRRLLRPFLQAAKDHFACRGLMNGRNNDIDTLVDHPAPAIHHDHRAIIQIRHALVCFLAFTKNQNPHGLAGEHGRLQRLRQLVDVQHREALHCGHLVQVEVVGNNFCADAPRQLHQFVVHVPSLPKIILQNPHLYLWHFLNPLQHFEPAPSALPLQRVRRIGDHLKFVQHELRHSENAFQELRIAYIDDPAVDQYAGVQKLYGFCGNGLLAKEPVEGLNMQFPAPARANGKSEIAKREQCGKLKEGLGGFGFIRAGNHQGHEQSGKYTEDRAKRPAQ